VKAKPVFPRAQAARDVDAAIAYYLEQRAVDEAMGFVDAVGKAYGHIGRDPAAGAPGYAHELNLPELRF
jgi:toxin ParE1/3/4